MSDPSPRVLFAIAVYNGPDVVPGCLRSAARVDHATCAVDILALDDASPMPGFSGEVERLCGELGIGYYRSPRNLGIPRNFNLALLKALKDGYDFVVLANSDVMFSARLVDQLVAVASSDDAIGSVTAWSNHASIYSLPNTQPERFLTDQTVVNWVAETIAAEFGNTAVDIPVGVGFCMCIPTRVVRVVGLMDPVFGRGYCEENDWTLRSQALGFRITLSPSAFAYHVGGSSTVAAGLVSRGAYTVPANERILDLRYPLYRKQVGSFQASKLLDTLIEKTLTRIVVAAAAEWGYDITIGHLRGPETGAALARIALERLGDGFDVVGAFRGFTGRMDIRGDDLVGAVVDRVGREPVAIRLYDQTLRRGLPRLSADHPELVDEVTYPSRV
jgi:GT2 family glycosyltransferase